MNNSQPPVEKSASLDWNAPSAYQRATIATATGVGTQGLVEEYTIDTPENVAFRYEIAGIGSRSIGGIIDSILIIILLVALALAVGAAADWLPRWLGLPSILWLENLFFALYFLLNFAIFWGYYLLFELFWNGQSPGKRVAKTRVVRSDGMPAGFSESSVRNLVRIIDFLPTAYAIGLVTMLFNSSTRRLGDFAAGTLVIHDQGEITLDSLLADDNLQIKKSRRPRGSTAGVETSAAVTPASLAAASAPAPGKAGTSNAPPMPRNTDLAADLESGPYGARLEALSRDDVELMRDALKREWRGQIDQPTLARLVRAIANKSGALAPPNDRSSMRRFLSRIADAWELAQATSPPAPLL